jgi:DNA mismatch endonuclease (patch repair protein)
VDTRTREKRSEIMAAVRSKNTGPELAVRRLVSNLGYRYRLHSARLPGRPDLVFTGKRQVVFVHGCFWHGHDCSKGRLPKTRRSYWKPKIAANRGRDSNNLRDLRSAGWRSLVIWQCELRDAKRTMQKLARFLGSKPRKTRNVRKMGMNSGKR